MQRKREAQLKRRENYFKNESITENILDPADKESKKESEKCMLFITIGLFAIA